MSSNKLSPVFIMGAPRSGTTMLASMLSSHPDSIALPEMHYIFQLLLNETIFGELTSNQIYSELHSHYMFRELDVLSEQSEYKSVVSTDVLTTVSNIINLYNDKYYNKNYKYWIEHTPFSHKYFDVIRLRYPNARFIHIVRDGRAVYSSTKKTDWGYKDVVTGARHWRASVIDCLVKERCFPSAVKTIRYEDVTENPESIVTELCDFLGMDYHECMLDGKGYRKPGYSKYTNDLNKKPNKKSHEKWKHDLAEYEIQHFTAINSDLLNHLGYSVDSSPKIPLTKLRRYYHLIAGTIKAICFKYLARKRIKKYLD